MVNVDTHKHRRRIKTDEKAKVVAAAWGAELNQLINLFAALAILHQDNLKNMINSIRTI